MTRTNDFSGVWHSLYRYTSATREGEFTSEYDVKIHREGDYLVVQSTPNDEGSYMLMRLSLDGRIATGTWEEHTSPTGHYQGVIYHGALQLIMDEDGNALRGKYVGFSRVMKVLANDWEIVRKK